MWRDYLKSPALFLATVLSSVSLAYLIIKWLMVRGFGLSYSNSSRPFQAAGDIPSDGTRREGVSTQGTAPRERPKCQGRANGTVEKAGVK